MADALCVSRQGTAANHCWHDTGRSLMSNPPQAVDVCCFCGAVRALPVRIPVENPIGHGPHHPTLTALNTE